MAAKATRSSASRAARHAERAQLVADQAEPRLLGVVGRASAACSRRNLSVQMSRRGLLALVRKTASCRA